MEAIDKWLKECKLGMHPEKSGVVYCQDGTRKKRIRTEIRECHIPRQTSASLNEPAKGYNHRLRGWLNYLSHPTKSPTREIRDYFGQALMRRARRRYGKLTGKWQRSERWSTTIKSNNLGLLAIGSLFGTVTVRIEYCV